MCGTTPHQSSSATRTDDLGRARLAMAARTNPASCSLVVAKPGYATSETTSVQLCDAPNQCPPTYITMEVAP